MMRMSEPQQRRPAFLRRHQGVRVRSTVVACLLVALALLIGAFAMLLMLHRADSRAMYDSTSYRAYEISDRIRDAGVTAIPDEELTTGTGIDIIQVIDTSGRVVTASPGALALPITDRQPAPWTAETTEQRMVPGDDAQYCATIVGTAHGNERYTVVTAVSSGPYRDGLLNTAVMLAVGLPILVALAGVVIYFFVGRALLPVGEITRQATMITSSDLSLRVPVPGTDDEITGLATTVNSMLDRLEQGRQTQLRFIGDASHEMRSPLTTVVGILDLADDTDSDVDLATVRTILLPEARRMQNMVDDLLLLARADERGLAVRSDDVDLDDVVVEEARRLRLLGLARVATTIVPIRVTGDRDKLTRALRNVADNAARYAESLVTFDMHSDIESGTATIRVIDDGPGIPRAQRADVFERFTRLDIDRRNRAGSGLGLSIVAEIVRAHGGTVRIVDPPAGHGTSVEIILPAADMTSAVSVMPPGTEFAPPPG
ncbi:HAMP domain-containing sensor histidine kinase [Gordonia sp. Z-3]|uniref:HAMP domain-containing sensor histidine kinase n=1 Tax=Gordonia sp. Z-3 TaxID=3115408 RepID=UPI002E2E4135|nr:HAMP domain-containing sensor histidine kinase [Gordonia sp. Z-3]MED5799950.1 HAMP domain-containing sensor histidine kinase [Gordonia sp. Z-3]